LNKVGSTSKKENDANSKLKADLKKIREGKLKERKEQNTKVEEGTLMKIYNGIGGWRAAI